MRENARPSNRLTPSRVPNQIAPWLSSSSVRTKSWLRPSAARNLLPPGAILHQHALAAGGEPQSPSAVLEDRAHDRVAEILAQPEVERLGARESAQPTAIRPDPEAAFRVPSQGPDGVRPEAVIPREAAHLARPVAAQPVRGRAQPEISGRVFEQRVRVGRRQRRAQGNRGHPILVGDEDAFVRGHPHPPVACLDQRPDAATRRTDEADLPVREPRHAAVGCADPDAAGAVLEQRGHREPLELGDARSGAPARSPVVPP